MPELLLQLAEGEVTSVSFDKDNRITRIMIEGSVSTDPNILVRRQLAVDISYPSPDPENFDLLGSAGAIYRDPRPHMKISCVL